MIKSAGALDDIEYTGPKCKKDTDEDDDDEYENEAGKLKWCTPELEEESHFVMINYNRKTFEKGEQVHISYGNWSNFSLLIHYGFAIPDNIFDSYSLFLRVDFPGGVFKVDEQFVINGGTNL
jgi:hypothetical protein